MSAPKTAIGSSPTAERTEKRPPISSGTTKVSKPSSSASFFSAPFFASVVANIRSFSSSAEYLPVSYTHLTLPTKRIV